MRAAHLSAKKVLCALPSAPGNIMYISLLKARAAMAGHVDSWCQTYADTTCTDRQTRQHSDI